MKKKIEDMDIFELGRWLCLVESVNLIAEECEQRNVKFDYLRLEPLTIKKYIEGTCDHKVIKIEEDNKKLHRNEQLKDIIKSLTPVKVNAI